jgi:hypothetical protein
LNIEVFGKWLLRQPRAIQEEINQLRSERQLLALLAADGPAFYNPLEAMAAQTVRDRVLAVECRRRPNGDPIR